MAAGTSSFSLQVSKCVSMPTRGGVLMADSVGTWSLPPRGQFFCLECYQPRKEDSSLPWTKRSGFSYTGV